ncbi:MAG: Crp/Fnr family transcriptional regulator [Bacteroidales bacterium]|nr:Crp/Fnr family transcriptional regulator [Bacteroidales bacterium]
MDEDKKLWYFENFNILKPMSMKEKMELSEKTDMEGPVKDEIIYLQGDASHSIYFLKKGKVRIYTINEEGREMTHAILGPGEIFGELAISGAGERDHIAAATEDAIICEVKTEVFEEFLEKNPKLNLQITKLIGFRLKKIQSRLETMWFKSAPERIKTLLSDLGEEHGEEIGDEIVIRLKLTHQEIASLAATTRQTVTTTLNKLEKDGVILYDRKRILIKKPQALK